jgi:hypothetical protein
MESGMATIVNRTPTSMARAKKTKPIDPILLFAIENKNYFAWPMDIKQEACNRLAIWLTNLSFAGPLSRQELIDYQIQEAEQEEEYEYIQFVKDVETFFKTKNWQHLNDGK